MPPLPRVQVILQEIIFDSQLVNKFKTDIQVNIFHPFFNSASIFPAILFFQCLHYSGESSSQHPYDWLSSRHPYDWFDCYTCDIHVHQFFIFVHQAAEWMLFTEKNSYCVQAFWDWQLPDTELLQVSSIFSPKLLSQLGQENRLCYSTKFHACIFLVTVNFIA